MRHAPGGIRCSVLLSPLESRGAAQPMPRSVVWWYHGYLCQIHNTHVLVQAEALDILLLVSQHKKTQLTQEWV